jgi:hypothetical protein
MSGRGGDPAWVVWLSLAALVTLIVGGVSTAIYVARSGMAAGFADAEAFANPETGKVGKTLQAKFPDEYARLEKRLQSLRDEGADVSEIRVEFATFAAEARVRHLEQAAQAPHESLVALRKAEIDALERLAEVGPTACAMYVTTGLPSGIDFDKQSQALETDAHAAFWSAAAAGRDRPAAREVDILSNQDAVALDEALRARGISEADLQQLNRLEDMSSDKQCEIGILRLRAIDGLPADTADRIHASLMLGNL